VPPLSPADLNLVVVVLISIATVSRLEGRVPAASSVRALGFPRFLARLRAVVGTRGAGPLPDFLDQAVRKTRPSRFAASPPAPASTAAATETATATATAATETTTHCGLPQQRGHAGFVDVLPFRLVQECFQRCIGEALVSGGIMFDFATGWNICVKNYFRARFDH
jgi:hypothetical protein